MTDGLSLLYFSLITWRNLVPDCNRTDRWTQLWADGCWEKWHDSIRHTTVLIYLSVKKLIHTAKFHLMTPSDTGSESGDLIADRTSRLTGVKMVAW